MDIITNTKTIITTDINMLKITAETSLGIPSSSPKLANHRVAIPTELNTKLITVKAALKTKPNEVATLNPPFSEAAAKAELAISDVCERFPKSLCISLLIIELYQ